MRVKICLKSTINNGRYASFSKSIPNFERQLIRALSMGCCGSKKKTTPPGVYAKSESKEGVEGKEGKEGSQEKVEGVQKEPKGPASTKQASDTKLNLSQGLDLPSMKDPSMRSARGGDVSGRGTMTTVRDLQSLTLPVEIEVGAPEVTKKTSSDALKQAVEVKKVKSSQSGQEEPKAVSSKVLTEGAVEVKKVKSSQTGTEEPKAVSSKAQKEGDLKVSDSKSGNIAPVKVPPVKSGTGTPTKTKSSAYGAKSSGSKPAVIPWRSGTVVEFGGSSAAAPPPGSPPAGLSPPGKQQGKGIPGKTGTLPTKIPKTTPGKVKGK